MPTVLILGRKDLVSNISSTNYGPKCSLSSFSLSNQGRCISAISFGSENITKPRFGELFLLIFLLFFTSSHQELLPISGNFHLLMFSYSLSLFLSQGILVLLLNWRLLTLKVESEMEEEYKPEWFL